MVVDSMQILVLVVKFIEFIEVTTSYKPPGRLADETNNVYLIVIRTFNWNNKITMFFTKSVLTRTTFT